MTIRRFAGAAICAAIASCMACAPVRAENSVDACLTSASQYHRVNRTILQAILVVESGGRFNVVSKNSNDSIDVGIAGTNSVHFPELAKHGITPKHLFDPCVSIYVAGWNLSKSIARRGNTWYGIAAYHSTTPYHNNRYQVLLRNALIDLGALSGRKLKVPPLRPQASSK